MQLVMKQTNVTSSTMRIRDGSKGASPAKAESEMAEWLSAAAQASEYQGNIPDDQNTVLKARTQVQQGDENEDASENAKMMRSPSRKRTSSAAPSNRASEIGRSSVAKAMGTVSKTQEVPDGLRGRAVEHHYRKGELSKTANCTSITEVLGLVKAENFNCGRSAFDKKSG